MQKLLAFELFSAFFTIIGAFLFHYLFAWSGNNRMIGAVSAVNESVWEHVKIIFFPYLLFAVFEYFALGLDFKQFFVAKTIGLLAILVVTIAFFYIYSGILGENVMAIDIASAIAWSVGANIISYVILRSPKDWSFFFVPASILFIVMISAFIFFTYFPPKIGLFRDPTTGKYGI